MDARAQRRLRREAYKDSAEWKAKEQLKEEKREKARVKASMRAKVKAKAKAKEEAELKAKEEAELKAKAEEELKAKAEAKAKKEYDEEVKRRKKTFKQELSNATKNEKALYKLLTSLYEEALGGHWRLYSWYERDSSFWYEGMETEVLWTKTKQLLKNEVGLTDEVKNYYTNYAVVREFLKNDYKNCPEENPLFKYQDMDDVVRVLEKMDEFQKKLDKLCPKKCSLYYKPSESGDYYNELMKDLEKYQQHWLSNWGQCDPYFHQDCSVEENGYWDWEPGFMECTPVLNWLEEQE